MKPLSKEFQGKGEVKGFKFTQISKTDSAFLYKVNTGDQIHYEVFKRIINTRFTCESYPTSKAFGLWAYSIMELDRAIEKFNQLNFCD